MHILSYPLWQKYVGLSPSDMNYILLDLDTFTYIYQTTGASSLKKLDS